MAFSKEQRIIRQVRGRNKSSKGKQIDRGEQRQEIGTGMYAPNHSGDHSAGNVRTTPSQDLDLVNKKYVDDETDKLKADLSINFFMDGGGAVINTGIIGWLQVDFKCEIQSATLLADQSGSIVIDIWKDTYANYPPTNADSITAAAPPTITAATKSTDSTLTGWTTEINAGDILYFNVDSVATIEKCLLVLKVNRTE